MENQLITQAQANVEKSVKPADQQNYQKIIQAGMKLLYIQQTHQMLMQGLDQEPDKIKAVAEGMVAILGLMFKESRNTMPPVPMIQAGMSLLLNVLDFLEQGGMIQVTADDLSRATQIYMDTLLPKLGITPQMMQNVMAKTQGVMQDPQKMALLKQNMGG